MKYLLLNFFIVILLFTSCKESTSGSSGKQILAYKTDERELPDNTLKVFCLGCGLIAGRYKAN